MGCYRYLKNAGRKPDVSWWNRCNNGRTGRTRPKEDTLPCAGSDLAVIRCSRLRTRVIVSSQTSPSSHFRPSSTTQIHRLVYVAFTSLIILCRSTLNVNILKKLKLIEIDRIDLFFFDDHIKRILILTNKLIDNWLYCCEQFHILRTCTNFR